MDQTEQQGPTMAAVSNAMVKLHKEQFGRGPTLARSHYAGPDALVCVLEDVLLPAERKLVALGDADRVRESRTSFQVATQAEFIEAVEQIVDRQVRSFASAIDPLANVVFENFDFHPVKSGADRPPAPPGAQPPQDPVRVPADPKRHQRAEGTHLRNADAHAQAAVFWDSRDVGHAAAEREKEQHDRDGAQLERDRYRDETAT